MNVTRPTADPADGSPEPGRRRGALTCADRDGGFFAPMARQHLRFALEPGVLVGVAVVALMATDCVAMDRGVAPNVASNRVRLAMLPAFPALSLWLPTLLKG